MAFVKLDCGILNSSLWDQMAQRNVFITALLMARPYEMKHAVQAIEVDSLLLTKLVIPAGFYGLVEAAGIGIIRMAGIGTADGMCALKALCDPDDDSRSSDFEGRRMARIDGGFIILNYQRYRDKDHTAALRMRRYRERRKRASRRVTQRYTVTPRNVTQAEAEAEADSKCTTQDEYTFPQFKKPSRDEVNLQAAKIGLPEIEVDRFVNFYESNGWKVGKNPMKSWIHALNNWKLNLARYENNSRIDRNSPGRPVQPVKGSVAVGGF